MFLLSDLDRDVFAAPLAEPNLAVAASADFPDHLDLPGDGSLDEVRESRPGTGSLLDQIGQRSAVNAGFRVLSGGRHVLLLPEVLSLLVPVDICNAL